MAKRILVVDDDDVGRMMICAALSRAGYEVCEAKEGQSCAFHLKSKGAPDLIITDIVMPQKDGLELIMDIKRDYPQIKLIAISGGGSGWGGDYLVMSQRLGSDATFPKPVDLDQLVSAVKQMIGAEDIMDESAA